MNHPIPVEVLRQLIRLEPETGRLFWLPRERQWFPDDRSWKAWNTRYQGREALASPRKIDGRRVGSIFGRNYLAYQVVWALHTGEWVDKLDHENRIPSDDRPSNLRPCTQALNMLNVPSHRDARSRFKGVWWHRKNKRWIAEFRGKHIGCFVLEEDAAIAYNEVAEAHSAEFARLNEVETV